MEGSRKNISMKLHKLCLSEKSRKKMQTQDSLRSYTVMKAVGFDEFTDELQTSTEQTDKEETTKEST